MELAAPVNSPGGAVVVAVPLLGLGTEWDGVTTGTTWVVADPVSVEVSTEEVSTAEEVYTGVGAADGVGVAADDEVSNHISTATLSVGTYMK